MAANQEAKFPTFECVISKSQEDFDSDVVPFFTLLNELTGELAKARSRDPEWAENYEEMMRYLKGLHDALLGFIPTPSHEFLIELSLGEELEDDRMERLLRSKNDLVPDLEIQAQKVREIMYWFVHASRNAKFSGTFTPDKFQGLPFLRLVLSYRSVNLANRS